MQGDCAKGFQIGSSVQGVYILQVLFDTDLLRSVSRFWGMNQARFINHLQVGNDETSYSRIS